MLICPKCDHENLDRQLFCAGCGERLDIDQEKITETIQETIKVEREDSTFQLAQQTLFLAIFLLLSVLLFRATIAADPPQVDILPLVEDPASTLPKYKQDKLDLLIPVPLPTDW